MGIWDSIKAIAVEDVPDEKDGKGKGGDAKAKADAGLPSTLPAVPGAVSPRPTDPARAEAMRKAMLKELAPVLDASKFQGEISDTMAALQESIPDKTALLKAAVKMITRRGPTVVDLIGDVDSCIGLLQKKGRDFNANLDSEMEKRIGSKRQRKAELQEQVSTRRAQIEAAQQEIARFEAESESCDRDIIEEQHSIDEVRGAFNQVYREAEVDLESRKSKLSTISSGG